MGPKIDDEHRTELCCLYIYQKINLAITMLKEIASSRWRSFLICNGRLLRNLMIDCCRNYRIRNDPLFERERGKKRNCDRRIAYVCVKFLPWKQKQLPYVYILILISDSSNHPNYYTRSPQVFIFSRCILYRSIYTVSTTSS